MKTPLTTAMLSAAAGALLLSAAPAQADPPHCPPGHQMQGRCDNDGYRDRDRDDWEDRRDEDRAYREGYRDGQRAAWQRGDRFDAADYKVIRDYNRYNLQAPPPGYYYAEVDGEVLMVQAATQIIAELMD